VFGSSKKEIKDADFLLWHYLQAKQENRLDEYFDGIRGKAGFKLKEKMSGCVVVKGKIK
jgi:hypothetical protein